MSKIYGLTVAIDGADVVYGGGPMRVFSYLTNVALEELKAAEGKLSSVKVTDGGGNALLDFSGDADDVATLLEGRRNKLRKAEKTTENGEE